MLIRRGKFSILFLLSSLAFGAGTRTWEQSQFEELAKGTTENVAIRSDGGLELAPTFKAIVTTPSAYIWSIATDQSGSLYAGAGTPARVYRVSPDGKSSVIFQSQELQVQAVAVDASGAVYAATNPDGKVYRLTSGNAGQKSSRKAGNISELDSTWNSTVYFDPGAKYIWDLALDKEGNLYVATGDKGEIFRVTQDGEPTLFFKSDETHIRVVAFDNAGNLIAGSDGSGLVYRISRDGNGFVLYSAPKKEITALAVGREGDIYAAGAGEKHSSPASTPGSSNPSSSSASSSAAPSIGFSMGGSGSVTPPAGGTFAAGAGGAGGSEIYRISPEGAPSRIWSSRDDLVYCLAFDQNGELLAGTGNRGHVFRIRGKDQFTDLLKASASQVTAFAHSSGNSIYASSSNLGKVFLLGAAVAPEGTYSSDVLDAHIFSRWGRAELRGNGNVELYARSGNVDNPDRNWSVWEKIDWRKDPEVRVPPARFIQWKTVLHAGRPAPHVDSLTINYLSKNVAPEFDELTVQDGVRYPPIQKPSIDGVGSGREPQRFDNSSSATHDRGSIGIKWNVHDENDDELVYSVYYRGENESGWLLLKDKLTDKSYSFDSSLLPDGAYTVKIVASDAPSHSSGDALTAEKQSGRFEIDTTPPRIEGLTASPDGDQIHVSFTANDSFSPIQHAEISVDAGDFQYVEPVNRISDSKTEHYDLRVGLNPESKRSEHVVVVRAYDRHENMASAKTVTGK